MSKVIYFCKNCGGEQPKWVGQCPYCKEWNTLTEQPTAAKSSKKKSTLAQPSENQQAQILSEIEIDTYERLALKDMELNRVLGGGLVRGSLVLLAGEPGIGKSTLLLQLALNTDDQTIIYNSAEESKNQIKRHCERLTTKTPEHLYISSDTCLESIDREIIRLNPSIVVIDSIQTIYTNTVDSSPGTVSQVRECTHLLMRIAKERHITILIIGHITKEGQIAGPKLLEHMVDVVIQFEGDKKNHFRLIRALKNRYGSTLELGMYEMTQLGLVQVDNPSMILTDQHAEPYSGNAKGIVQDGTQPLIIECQALVGGAVYGTPQRNTTGLEIKRLNMFLAILEKSLNINLRDKDVFFNLVGGFKVQDTGLDLGSLVAIISSYKNVLIPSSLIFTGEIGLSGELRPVSFIEKRITEVEKLGFESLILPKRNLDQLTQSFRSSLQISLIGIGHVSELMNYI